MAGEFSQSATQAHPAPSQPDFSARRAEAATFVRFGRRGRFHSLPRGMQAGILTPSSASGVYNLPAAQRPSGPAAQRPSGPAAQRPSGMTCARRLAGARKPAPATGSASRPDPRRRRARLPGLLPALALLLGALSLLPAAPAQAQIPAPANIVATPGNGKLVVTWTAAASTIYFVGYTSSQTVGLQDVNGLVGTTHATHWKLLTGNAIAAATYTVPNLSNGTTYRVRVQAVTQNGNSAWAEASGTPRALAAPGGIDVTRDRTAGGVLRVTWERVSGATGYEAEWRLASDASAVGSDTAIAATKGTSSDAFYITGLTDDTAYEFRVRAKDADGGGTWSGWHGGTPQAAAAVIWTGTLNTGARATLPGCNSGAPCATNLSPNTFTVAGTQFTFTEVNHRHLGAAEFALVAKVSPDVTTALSALQFCSGPLAIPMTTGRGIIDADALVNSRSETPVVDWQPNTQVTVRIGSDCAQAAESEWPLVAPRLDGLTLTAGGTPLTLIQGRIHPDQGGPGNTGFEGSTQRYMAVVPYGTSEVTLTPEFTNAFGQASSARDHRYRGGGRPVFTEAERVLTFVSAIDSGSSYTLRLGPSEEGGKKLELWKRYTEVLVRVYRRHPYYPHTKLEYTYTVLIVQGGPIPVDLSVEGLTGNVLPNGGTATLKATIPVPLPMDTIIPLTVGYAEAQKGDVLFRPNPDHPNAYYGLDRPVDIFMERGETEASIEIVSRPDPDRTSNELLLIQLDSSGFPVAGSTRWGSNAVEVAPWTLTEGSSTSPTLSLGAAMPSTEPRVVGITAELFALIQKIEGWRDDPARSWHRPHVMRWNRVLLALGWSTVTPASDASLEPMSAAEAQTYADRGWTRWVEVAEALRELEPVAVTIAGGDPVTEGEAAAFTLTVSRARAADLAVAVSVADVSGRGAFAAAPGTRTVTVPAGSTSAAFTVATVDDAEDEADGWVAATLAAGRGYTLGDAAHATVAVADNDASDPVVTIAGGAPVTEGAAAGFTLRASPAPLADLAVAVTVSQSGAFADASALGARTVTIPAGGTSAAFTVATVDDAEDEADGAVVATLAAGAGYTLGEAARARVAVADNDEGLPEIVTKRSTAREGTDDAVVFTVRLGRAASHAVTVDWVSADGVGRWMGFAPPATAGADYTASSGTLTFAPGQTFGSVRVPILDDAIDEGMEHFLVKFSNPQGATLAAPYREAVGLIRNDDHLQSMWLSRFGRTVGSQVTDAVSERLSGGLAPGAHATLAGQSVDLTKTDDGQALTDVLTGFAQALGAPGAPANDDPGSGAGAGPFARHGLGSAWNDPVTTSGARPVTGRELLLGSSFHVAGTGEGSGPGLAAWGRVAHGSFDGEHADDTGSTRVDGEVLTGVLGADADFGRLLAGVAVSLSEGDGRFDSPGADVGGKGKIESTMTTVSPYARFKLTERVSAWGLAGWGTGDMTIRFDDGVMDPVRTDLSMQMGAIGARGALLTQDGTGGMDLALKTDAFFVALESERAVNSVETQADASRVRLVLEGGRTFAVGGGATIRPLLELGVRYDGGDAETGAGVEVGGGVAYADAASGLSVDARARMLAAHADSDYEEWGASATVRLDPGETGRGLSLSLAPTIGTASSATERLWGARDARGLAPGGAFDGARTLQAELSYGMALPGDFTGTPNLGLGLWDGGARDWRVGWRLTPAAPRVGGFEVNVDAIRREAAADGDTEHRVMLQATVRSR